ncbi:MAG: hypothetical protein RL619_1467 [Bacteroidota bacterium]|jgi:sugar phosphate isomerase/epimerase|uniref:Family 16 glycoside hydrolase n=1 Tax=Flavobacterium sp. WC2409 TaxID=3234139 RepID=A0AB39W7A6_9FLAO
MQETKGFNKQSVRLKLSSVLILILCLFTIVNSNAQTKNKAIGNPVNLLDDNLTYWYKLMGVPHKTVQGLPPGTPTGDGMYGKSMGANDPKEVFKVITLNGEKVLKVTGEIYGGLTTKAQYENYHLQLKYKWGSKKWEPRLNLSRDTGIMYHLAGSDEDAFWGAFLMGAEFQIAQGSTGDAFLIPNNDFTSNTIANIRKAKGEKWNVKSPLNSYYGNLQVGEFNRSENFESELSKWTTIDLYTIGNSAVYLVNGHIVNAIQNIGTQKQDLSVTSLSKGKIQLQSEGAEVYYKDISIESITDYPTAIKKTAGFSETVHWKSGIALFTFNNYSFPEQLELAKSTGLKYIEGYTFGKAGPELRDSLIMNLSPSGIQKLNKMVQKSGLKMESLFILGGETIDKWKRDFELAKGLNVKFVSAEPPLDMLDAIDSLAGVYGIKVALHNHWKGKSDYWNPDLVLAALKNHPNLGACPDIGHWPKSGINPVKGLKKLEGHILGIHFKDIAEYNNVTIKDVTIGTGMINFPEVFAELKRQNFTGNINIERDQKDLPNNLNSVTQSIMYCDKITNVAPTISTPLPLSILAMDKSNRSIRHSVVFKLKNTLTDLDKKQFFEEVNKLAAIIGVEKFEILKQTNIKTKFDYGISMIFKDDEAYQIYSYHPNHLAFIKNYWSTKVEDFLEIDYEAITETIK